jgi:hypothetical protein
LIKQAFQLVPSLVSFHADSPNPRNPKWSANNQGVGMLRSIFAVGLIGMAMMMLPGLASAQATYICPTGPGPGERQIGMTNGGQGVASVPVCVADGGTTTSASPPVDPVDGLVSAVRNMYKYQSFANAEIDRMKDDPRYRQYMEGDWKFYGNTRRGRKRCVAIFMKQDQAIMLAGPSAPGQPGHISFVDYRDDAIIPTPKKPREVQLTLTQNNGSPLPMSGVNDTGSSGEGIILSYMPMNALLNGIDDVLAFKIEVEDKLVVDNAWHSGRKAQDFLRKCVGL